MEWRDQGILLWVRRHGETSVIIEVLTPERGRHAGLVRGGAGKTQGPVLQPGAQLSLEWNARLADHLGAFRVDLIRARAAAIMADRRTLAALNAVSALLVRLLPEREPNPEVYAATLGLVDALVGADPRWPARYAAWELTLLEALGFGLDLASCASTGRARGSRLCLAALGPGGLPRRRRALCRAPAAAAAVPGRRPAGRSRRHRSRHRRGSRRLAPDGVFPRELGLPGLRSGRDARRAHPTGAPAGRPGHRVAGRGRRPCGSAGSHTGRRTPAGRGRAMKPAMRPAMRLAKGGRAR